jgi:DNA-binding transcriptional MerR regulator
MSLPDNEWIKTTEAVRITGLSEGMLRKLSKEGKLVRKSNGRGQTAYYKREDILKLAQEREEEKES